VNRADVARPPASEILPDRLALPIEKPRLATWQSPIQKTPTFLQIRCNYNPSGWGGKYTPRELRRDSPVFNTVFRSKMRIRFDEKQLGFPQRQLADLV
jgi:hypothetical protein